MSANMSHDHVVYHPSTISYGNAAVQRPAGTSRSSGLGQALSSAMKFIASIPSRQAVKNELSRLSDRELADIGLSRSEISTVFSRTR